MNIKQCWQMEELLQVFRIPIRISNPGSDHSEIKYCLFDTGFSGYLGLEKDTIDALNLPKTGEGRALTVQGIITYENYSGIAEIVNENQEILETISNSEEKNDSEKNIIPIQEFNVPILGMKAICQFSWFILSEQKIICLLK